MASERLLKKIRSGKQFLRENLRNKDVIIITFIENITDLNKKLITQSFSYNQHDAED